MEVVEDGVHLDDHFSSSSILNKQQIDDISFNEPSRQLEAMWHAHGVGVYKTTRLGWEMETERDCIERSL